MVPFHPWYARLAGKETYVHRMGLMDTQYANRLHVADLELAIRQKRFAAIVLDKYDWPLRVLENRYRIDQMLPTDERPRSFTGAKTMPRSVWIPVGPAGPPPPDATPLFDFEDGGFDDWILVGKAWGSGPRTRKLAKQRAVYGYRGLYFATSFHGGDAATGTMTSREFVIEGRKISALIGGGRTGKLRVELRVGGKTVASSQGSGSGGLRRETWNVAAHAGKRATIVAIDEDPGGHLSIDEFWIWE